MSARPPFDPRCELRAALHDGQRAMSVYLDGEERIEQGLVIGAGDPLVALRACPCCELFECELVEGYAASVRRFGPYVLWLTSWGELRCFDRERYEEVFGGDAEDLPAPAERDAWLLDAPATRGAWRCPDGRALHFDAELAPEEPLARLSAWRGGACPGLEPVPPPASALELPSLDAGTPSLWIESAPSPDGRRAAFLPGVFILPVWLAGPAVDRIVTAAVGPPDAP